MVEVATDACSNSAPRARRHPDELATVAALLMSSDGAYITGSDILIDGGVAASYFYGNPAKGCRSSSAVRARAGGARGRARRGRALGRSWR
jgi:hypothetical protein